MLHEVKRGKSIFVVPAFELDPSFQIPIPKDFSSLSILFKMNIARQVRIL